MQIEHLTIQGIPLIFLSQYSPKTAKEKGCILCYHGLSSSKDDWLHDLEIIAKSGFLVVGIDNVGHGERKDPDFETTYSQSNPDYWRNFVQAVQSTVEEMPILIDELIRLGFANEHKIGGLGVSMGGFILYSAILLEPRLSTVVTLVSSPEWWGFNHPESPHLHCEKFSNINLLSITGGNDITIPNSFTTDFHNKLEAIFKEYHLRFGHKIYPSSDHLMNPDWDKAWQQSIAWFEKYLTVQPQKP